jgi:hypothetical protein
MGIDCAADARDVGLACRVWPTASRDRRTALAYSVLLIPACRCSRVVSSIGPKKSLAFIEVVSVHRKCLGARGSTRSSRLMPRHFR